MTNTETVVNNLLEQRYDRIRSVFTGIGREDCFNRFEQEVADFSRKLDQLNYPLPKNVQKKEENAPTGRMRVFEFFWQGNGCEIQAKITENWYDDQVSYDLSIVKNRITIWQEDQEKPDKIFGILILFQGLLQ